MQPHPYLVGEPCQKVVYNTKRIEDDHYCGEPARFIYHGLVPELVLGREATQAEIKRFAKRGNPCKMLLCPDHAMQLATDFAWEIKDGKIRIERLDVIQYRSYCRKCLVFTLVQVALDSPTKPTQFVPKYCPSCGAPDTIRVDPAKDYWDVISEHFDNMPVELIKMLYVEWPRNRYRTFAMYVQAQIEAFDTEGQLMADDDGGADA